MSSLPTPDSVQPPITATIRSEWTKLWAFPSTPILIGVTGILTMGLTILITVFGGEAALRGNGGESRYQTIFYGSALGVFAYAFLAAGSMASEFRNGMIAYTLTATRSRSRVLVSKLIVLAFIGYVAGLLISLANLLVTQGGLAVAGVDLIDPTEPSLVRAILVFTGTGMMVQGLLACMMAVIFRNGTVAVITLILINTIPVAAAQFLGQGYASTVPRFLPGALLESIAGLSAPGTAGYLALPWAVTALLLWLAAAFTLALTLMRRRDI